MILQTGLLSKLKKYNYLLSVSLLVSLAVEQEILVRWNTAMIGWNLVIFNWVKWHCIR